LLHVSDSFWNYPKLNSLSMRLKDFELNSDNHFVAMQYYRLILNRTYLILLANDRLIGIKVNGLVAVEGGDNIWSKEISKMMAVTGDLQDPFSYINPNFFNKVRDLELADSIILAQDKANFVIHRADIIKAYHDPKKKWGMGYYPHDGKVYVITTKRIKKEFIILGNQSGHKIANLILSFNG
jgi:hypothetical protein